MKQHTTQIILGVIIAIILLYLIYILFPNSPFGWISGVTYTPPMNEQQSISNNLYGVFTTIFYFAKIFGVFTLLFGISLILKIIKN